MATSERPSTTKRILGNLGTLAIGATLTLAACGTSGTLSGTVQNAGERQSVVRDPGNPYWSRNTAVIETGTHRAILGDPGNPYWSRNAATPDAADVVVQRAPRPH